MSWFAFMVQHPIVVLNLSAQHALLSAEGTVLGAVVAIPFAMVFYRNARVRQTAESVTEIIQTIPSLALLAVLLFVFNSSNLILVLTLFLYSLMPMIHNTTEGLLNVDPTLVDVARGVGMSRTQVLFKVQVPQAMSVILAGFRMALVTSIGITTVGVLIGAGGLGKLIYEGMQQFSAAEIFAGAAPAAVMAIVLDALLAIIESRVNRNARRSASPATNKKEMIS